ncbi:MAG: oxidoreductase [Chloroflexi bacterium]|nr:MAG: oxidoreductase [Chloroflexota bacterium]
MYDAIIVGARCAGSPLAMLLARQGQKVLLVDRAEFPSDTVSTHGMKKPAVAHLSEWGLIDQVLASNCPPIHSLRLDVGPLVLQGSAPPIPGGEFDIAPRRYVLDTLLAKAAVAAGAEFRECFTVEDLLFDDGTVCGIRGHARGGASVEERARIVVGADGRNSRVAQAAGVPLTVDRGAFCCAYYSYFSGVPSSSIELYTRPGRQIIAFPTNDDLTMVMVEWPRAEFPQVRSDIEGTFMASLDLAPEFAERVRAGRREERFSGSAELPNYQRQAFGPGWALVGDALSHKDPILAQGITDAFHDAAFLAAALGEAYSGVKPLDAALADFAARHMECSMPLFEATCQFATLQPPPPEMQQLLGALLGNQPATDQFFGTIVGTVPMHEFYAPENLERIMQAAARVA